MQRGGKSGGEERVFRTQGICKRCAAQHGEGLDDNGYPEEGTRALSVKYSCPEWIIELWKQSLGSDVIETMLAEFQREKPITVRCCLNRITSDEFRKIMKEEE